MAIEKKTVSTHTHCNVCGRTYPQGRLTLKRLITEFIDTTFSLDKGFLFTVWMLLVKPMNPIKAYILGKRKPYTSPAKFLVVSVTLYVIGYLFIPIEELGMLKMNANEKEFVQLFYQNFQRYLNLGLFMLIPFISLFTFFMSYKTYNFAENLVANAYIQGVFNLFGIVLSLLGYALMQWDMKVGTSLSTLSFLILLRNYYFFFNGNKFIRVMKTLAAIFVSFLAIAIYALVLVFILSYVYDIKEGTEINLSN